MLTDEQRRSIEQDKERKSLCLAAPLHTSKHGWTTYGVMSPRGTTTNHHWEIVNGQEYLTIRVTPETATHATIVEAYPAGEIEIPGRGAVPYFKLHTITKELVTGKVTYENYSNNWDF